MASKLALYNGALLALGERKLKSLTEGRATRRALDSVYDDGGVNACLQAGLWNFAINSVQIDYSPSITPGFGYMRAFDKPANWVRTAMVSADAYFSAPLTRYQDEGNYWYADIDTIYVQYVDGGTSFGGDLSKWPANFTTYAEHWFAWRIAKRITGSDNKAAELEGVVKRLLSKAKATDAINEGVKFPPLGGWASARAGGNAGSRSLWNRQS